MKIFLLLFILIQSALASSVSGVEKDNLILAKDINNLLSQPELNFQKHNWAQLARRTQLNPMFSDFTWWFDTLEKIKTDNNFKELCDQYYYREDNNPMKEYLTKYVRKYCINSFLKGKSVLSNEDFQFVADNHVYFFENRLFTSQFRKYLSKNHNPEIKIQFDKLAKEYLEDHYSSDVLNLVQDKEYKKIILDKKLLTNKYKKIALTEKRKIKLMFKRLNKNPKVFDNYVINENLLEFSFYREIVYRIIHFYIRNKHKEKSLELLTKVIHNQNVNGELAFLYLWWGIRFNEEKKILEGFTLNEEFSKEPKTMFWYANSLQNVNRNEEAVAVYKKIIEEYTVNYYSIMASKKLKQIDPSSDYLKLHVMKNKNAHKVYTVKPNISSRLDRLNLWMQIKARKTLEMDIRSIQAEANKDLYNEAEAATHNDKHQINLMIAQKLHDNEFSLMAFRFFFELFNTQEVTISDLKALHPVKQLDLVQKYNQTLDPLLVISLIKQESGFNTKAKSHVGASGLMQIMPATARKLSGKRKNDLQNVEHNIKLGTKYLDILNKKWDKNLVFVLSSYNAGEARVIDWKKTYFNGDDLVGNVEAIPFLETNNYVKLIFRNLYFYKMTEDLSATDNAEVNKFYDVYLGF